jgi:membrane associated rhomboid family serine protease
VNADRLLRRLLLLLFVLSAVQAALNAAELPALSALGFESSGEALYYLPTWQIMWLHVGASAALAAVFWVLPERWPLPRDAGGGLAPHARARQRLLVWLGILTLLLLTAAMQFVYDANRTAIPHLRWPPLLALAAAYLAFLGAWLALWRRSRGAQDR